MMISHAGGHATCFPLIPTEEAIKRTESASHMNRLVVLIPIVSLPQCSKPYFAKVPTISSRSREEISKSLRSLISVKIQGCTKSFLVSQSCKTSLRKGFLYSPSSKHHEQS